MAKNSLSTICFARQSALASKLDANDDLVVSVIGKSQTVTVADWYASTDNHVGAITTNDGHEISDAGVQQMVEAMASYEQPSSGQTTLPPGRATALAPALAANWHQTG